MNIIIDSQIVVRVSDLSDEQLRDIRVKFSMPNPHYAQALRYSRWGAPKNMSPTLDLFDETTDCLIFPRGLVHQLKKILKDDDITVTDGRVKHPYEYAARNPKIHLDHAQREVISRCMQATQGVFLMPTGDGKSWTVLELAKQLKQKLLVVVHRRSVMFDSWVPHINYFFSKAEEYGIVKGNKCDYSHGITIAMVHTLRSRYKQLQAEGFFNAFGMVYYDEGHTAPAPTFDMPMNSFTAKYKFTGTATEKRSDGMHPKMYACFGEKLFERTYAEAQAEGKVMPLKMRIVRTGFDYEPPIKYFDRKGRRVFPPKSGGDLEDFIHDLESGVVVSKGADYTKLDERLYQDERRNSIVVREIIRDVNEDENNYIIATVKRKEHVDILQKMLKNKGLISSKITGDTPDKVRTLIRKAVNLGLIRVIICTSNTMQAGTNIKRLNRWHMVSPVSDETAFKQQRGRICRKHPLKKDAIIVAYLDETGLLQAMHRKRMKYITKRS